MMVIFGVHCPIFSGNSIDVLFLAPSPLEGVLAFENLAIKRAQMHQACRYVDKIELRAIISPHDRGYFMRHLT
jgi:hypothetical protein